MSRRVQLNHFLTDSDFFDKPKIKALAYKFGQLSVLYLLRLIASMSRATNAQVDEECALGIAYEMHLDEGLAKEIIAHCLAESILITEEKKLTSQRVIEDQERLAKARKDFKNRQDKKRSVTRDKCVTSTVSVNTEYLNTELLNNELIKENSQTPIPDEPPSVEPHEDLSKLTPEELVCEEKLEVATNQSWVNTNAYMMLKRRPMKKYPELFFSRRELMDITDNWRKSSIPSSKWSEMFKRAQAQIKKAIAEGQRPETKNIFSWLTGFIKHEMLAEIHAENKIKRFEERAA